MNDLDARIRAAVTALADAAPAPKPLPAMSADHDRSRRWRAIAAASVLIVGGIVAIAIWQTTRDDTVPVDTVDTTTPGVTLPPPPRPTTAPVTTHRTAPSERPRPADHARPGDVVAVDGSGALVLIGIDGDDVAPPVTLRGGTRRPHVTAHPAWPGSSTAPSCTASPTRATSAVMALTAPGAVPIELAKASGPWLSPDGERWAMTSSGQLVIQRTDGSPGATVDGGRLRDRSPGARTAPPCTSPRATRGSPGCGATRSTTGTS